MVFMPLNFLIIWLVGLLSIGLLGGGLYIIYEWYERELVGMSYLLTGGAMVLWSFAGRFPVLLLLRRKGSDEPKLMRTASWAHGIDGAEPAFCRSCQRVQCLLLLTQADL